MSRGTLAGSVALSALALGTAWLAAPARAGDPVKDLVKKVEARYQKTTDLTAEFSQTTDIKGFAKPLQSSGRVYIKRPASSGGITWRPRSSRSSWTTTRSSSTSPNTSR